MASSVEVEQDDIICHQCSEQQHRQVGSGPPEVDEWSVQFQDDLGRQQSAGASDGMR